MALASARSRLGPIFFSELASYVYVDDVSGLQVGPLHNALVVKIFHVFQVVATGAYYPKLEFENHKNQYFSWLLRSEHDKTNIFGNRMTKLTI